MTKAERMKERWKDPEFRKKQKESLKTRRKRGEVKAEKEEKAKRKATIRDEKNLKKEANVERNRKKEVVKEYLNNKPKEKINLDWMTCFCCKKILPVNKIVDKRFNICIDCK